MGDLVQRFNLNLFGQQKLILKLYLDDFKKKTLKMNKMSIFQSGQLLQDLRLQKLLHPAKKNQIKCSKSQNNHSSENLERKAKILSKQNLKSPMKTTE